MPRPASTPVFHLPFEHGAWWTFETCLVAGLLQGLAHDVDAGALGSLGLGMQLLFLASDWLTGLARKAVGGNIREAPQWRSTAGMALAGGGGLLLTVGWALTPQVLRLELGLVLMAWAAFSAVVLWMRVKLLPRDLRLMMASACLLTGPVLVLGCLALGGLGLRALSFWALWAWFFSWGVAYVQAWMRGNTLPRWRIELASAPFLLEALVLASVARWPGALVLSILSFRIFWRLKQRLQVFAESGERPRLPTSPHEIRLLGFEQVAWSLALSAIWTWRYWPGNGG